MLTGEIVSLANKVPSEYTEKEALKHFNNIDIGHWPSEKTKIMVLTEDGEITVTKTPRSLTVDNHKITPAGTIWLLTQFFKNFPPEAINILEALNSVDGDMGSVEDFINGAKSLLLGNSQLIRLKNKRIAFSENKVILSDNTYIYIYVTTDLDVDNSERITVIIPGHKALVYTYLIENSKLLRIKTQFQGQQLENLANWERAASSTELSTKLFSTEPVSKPMLKKLLKILNKNTKQHKTLKTLV